MKYLIIFLIATTIQAREINWRTLEIGYCVYDYIIEENAEKYNIPEYFILGWCYWESEIRPYAISRDTIRSNGKIIRIQINVGMLQIRSIGTDNDIYKLRQPEYNVKIACKMLLNGIKLYRGHIPDTITRNDLLHGLTVYSGGRGAYQRSGRKINKYAYEVFKFYDEILTKEIYDK